MSGSAAGISPERPTTSSARPGAPEEMILTPKDSSMRQPEEREHINVLCLLTCLDARGQGESAGQELRALIWDRLSAAPPPLPRGSDVNLELGAAAVECEMLFVVLMLLPISAILSCHSVPVVSRVVGGDSTARARLEGWDKDRLSQGQKTHRTGACGISQSQIFMGY